MKNAKKFSVAGIVLLFMILGIAATTPPGDEPHKNLKILPKNISHEDLDKVMDGFKAALGVRCDFCHAPLKSDSTGHKLDFPSDEKPEKNIARKMMKMAAKINKKYFSYNKNDQGQTVPEISCITCHRGNPHPGDKR